MNEQWQYRFIHPTATVPPVRMAALDYLVMVGWIVIAHSMGVEHVAEVPYLMPSRKLVLVDLLSEL